MWGERRVSVVLMTYAERDSIRSVIDGFYATGVVDERHPPAVLEEDGLTAPVGAHHVRGIECSCAIESGRHATPPPHPPAG